MLQIYMHKDAGSYSKSFYNYVKNNPNQKYIIFDKDYVENLITKDLLVAHSYILDWHGDIQSDYKNCDKNIELFLELIPYSFKYMLAIFYHAIADEYTDYVIYLKSAYNVLHILNLIFMRNIISVLNVSDRYSIKKFLIVAGYNTTLFCDYPDVKIKIIDGNNVFDVISPNNLTHKNYLRITKRKRKIKYFDALVDLVSNKNVDVARELAKSVRHTKFLNNYLRLTNGYYNHKKYDTIAIPSSYGIHIYFTVPEIN
jgi:hypothetical protein